MHIRLAKSFIALALSVAGANVFANDSIVRVGAGGLVLLKTADVRMLQEVLVISTKSVRVKYRFLNESANDIRATVAFPMPPYGWNSGESAVDSNVRPLRSFKLFLDGQPVPTQLNRRAVVGDRDITSELRKIGLSDSQIFETFGDCDVDAGWVKCGLTDKQSAEVARLIGNKKRVLNWKVAETVYWEQVFPAGREIEVTHEYAPFVGMSYSAPYQQGFGYVGGLPTAGWLDPPPDANEACLDEGAGQALTKKIKSFVSGGARMVWVTLHDVEYVLGTGRNWKGPIVDFKLRIEKESPDQIISVCFPGKAKRISSSIVEFTQSNYVPQDRLVIHFYTLTTEQ